MLIVINHIPAAGHEHSEPAANAYVGVAAEEQGRVVPHLPPPVRHWLRASVPRGGRSELAAAARLRQMRRALPGMPCHLMVSAAANCRARTNASQCTSYPKGSRNAVEC